MACEGFTFISDNGCRTAAYGEDPPLEYKGRLSALGVDPKRIYECYRPG